MGRFAHAAMPVDVFQYNDGAVDKHSHSKRNSCQTDHIQISSQKIHENEGADNTDRDGGRHDDGRSKTSKKNK